MSSQTQGLGSQAEKVGVMEEAGSGHTGVALFPRKGWVCGWRQRVAGSAPCLTLGLHLTSISPS